MTDRDRLIELIKQGVDQTPCNSNSDYDCEGVKCKDCESKSITDHLLANGIIVPPCKVGDKVYVVNTLFVSEYTINEMAYDNIFFRFYCANEDYAIECRSFMFFDERIGKTVFLTKEEAEEKLKEISNGTT